MKNKQKSSAPIHVVGCISIAGMACLTAFAVNLVLNDANRRSDAEYWAAFNSNSTASSDTENTDSSGTETSVPDETKRPADDSAIIDEPIVTDPDDERDTETTGDETVPVEKPEDHESEERPEDGSGDTGDANEDPAEDDKKPSEDGDIEEKPSTDNPHTGSHDNSGDGSGSDVGNATLDLTNCSLNLDGELVYTVQSGDWLCRIADRFGCTVTDIATENNIANPDLIYPKEQFVIPVSDEILAIAKANLTA